MRRILQIKTSLNIMIIDDIPLLIPHLITETEKHHETDSRSQEGVQTC